MERIGLIIPQWTNQYFSSIAHNFQKEYAKRGIPIIVVDSNNNKAHELSNIKLLSTISVDGLIFISVGDNGDAYKMLKEINIPLLVLDREIPSLENGDYLVNDNRLGIKMGVEYLHSLNHQKIAFIKGTQDTIPGRERYESFRNTCSELGIKIYEDLICEGDFMFSSGNVAVDKLLKLEEEKRPTAIFASNDIMAMGVIQRLQENNYTIPNDFSILGFDDIQFSSWICPKLTTIRQDVEGFAQQGVDLLTSRIEAKQNNMPKKIRIINPQLIRRASCRKI